MRNFMAAVARAIRAFTASMTVLVREGGRWILKSIPDLSFGAGADADDPGPSDEVRATIEDVMRDRSAFLADAEFDRVKLVAQRMWADIGLKPEHMDGVSDLELAWLRVLDKDMLHKIAMADAQQIRAHMRGKARIKGVVPYDRQAIVDIKSARAMAIAPKGRRTLRDVLEAEGLHP